MREEMNSNIDNTNMATRKWNEEHPEAPQRCELGRQPLIRFGWQPFIGSPNVIPFVNRDELVTNIIYKVKYIFFVKWMRLFGHYILNMKHRGCGFIKRIVFLLLSSWI